jgi:hypothetical protein
MEVLHSTVSLKQEAQGVKSKSCNIPQDILQYHYTVARPQSL